MEKMQMYRLPFPPDRPLFETIRNKYLLDVLKWLGDFHDPASETFLGVKTGSTWGVAYSLLCLFQARTIYLESELFPRDFDEKANRSTEYLTKKATFGTGTCHWEANIWDTAVITRALLLYTEVYPSKADELQRIEICEKSLRWLSLQVVHWHDLRYTLGLTELSQILRTLLVAQEVMPDKLKDVSDEVRPYVNQPDIILNLVEEIIHSAKPREIIVDEKSEQVIVWDDGIFGTAETIISLSKFLSAQAYRSNQNLRKKILDLIGPALRYLELHQRDGRWGIEEETAMALRAYVAGHKAWDYRLEPEPHIVFKALRYLCDEKTVFLDGSIAHEMEPTIYYTLALIETLRNWNLPDGLCGNKPTMELYDFILWNTPARSTYERLLRTKAESEASILREINESLTNRLISTVKQLGLWQSVSYFVVWLIALVLLVIFSDSVTATTLTVPIGFRIKDWEVFLALVGLWVTLGYAVYRFLIQKTRHEQ